MAANFYKYNANMNDRTYFTSVVTNSSGKTKRYFSNIESEIYFGDKEMDDIYQFEFSIEEKILPIYGYNCFYSSELVSGQRLIQGQFVVNYTDTMLIQNTLGGIDDSIYNNAYNEAYVPGGDSYNAIYNKSFDMMIGYGYYDLKDKQTYNATSQTIIGAKISGMHKILDSTGQPIMEVFNFVAKDFIEETIIESTTNNNTNNNTGSSGNGNSSDKNDSSNKTETEVIKSPYVCSDITNESEKAKNETYAKTNKCAHIVYSLMYQIGSIMLGISLNDGNLMSFDTSKKVTLEITGSVDNTNIPLLTLNAGDHGAAECILEDKYSAIFDKLIKNGTTYVTCTIKFKAGTTINNKNINYDVVCKNARIKLVPKYF